MAEDRQCALRIEITPGYDLISYASLWAAAVAAEEMCVLQDRLGFAIGLGTWMRANSLLLMISPFEYRFTVLCAPMLQSVVANMPIMSLPLLQWLKTVHH